MTGGDGNVDGCMQSTTAEIPYGRIIYVVIRIGVPRSPEELGELGSVFQ